MNAEASKAIFVGRRGTGKTAVTYFLTQREPKTTVVLLPQIFSIVEDMIGQNRSGDSPSEAVQDARQQHKESSSK